MSEEKIVKLEKVSSFASIVLLIAALLSILVFHSTVILPVVFALLYLTMMLSQVVLPVVRYNEVFLRVYRGFRCVFLLLCLPAFRKQRTVLCFNWPDDFPNAVPDVYGNYESYGPLAHAFPFVL